MTKVIARVTAHPVREVEKPNVTHVVVQEKYDATTVQTDKYVVEVDEEQVKIYKVIPPAQKFYQSTSIIDFGKRVSLEREQI